MYIVICSFSSSQYSGIPKLYMDAFGPFKTEKEAAEWAANNKLETERLVLPITVP